MAECYSQIVQMLRAVYPREQGGRNMKQDNAFVERAANGMWQVVSSDIEDSNYKRKVYYETKVYELARDVANAMASASNASHDKLGYCETCKYEGRGRQGRCVVDGGAVQYDKQYNSACSNFVLNERITFSYEYDRDSLDLLRGYAAGYYLDTSGHLKKIRVYGPARIKEVCDKLDELNGIPKPKGKVPICFNCYWYELPGTPRSINKTCPYCRKKCDITFAHSTCSEFERYSSE